MCVCVCVSSLRRQRLCRRVWCRWGIKPESFYPGPTWLWDSAAVYRPQRVRTHKQTSTLRISPPGELQRLSFVQMLQNKRVTTADSFTVWEEGRFVLEEGKGKRFNKAHPKHSGRARLTVSSRVHLLCAKLTVLWLYTVATYINRE